MKITFFHSNAVLVESAAAVGLCCTRMHNALLRCLPERKVVICDVYHVFDSVYIY